MVGRKVKTIDLVSFNLPKRSESTQSYNVFMQMIRGRNSATDLMEPKN